MNKFPSISVIINTDGRAASLAICLSSLRYLRYPNFEVVVVAGPTHDGTHELCHSHGKTIKFAECPTRNLSMSRNISIQISSGEIVAFLDDDSIPEPEWLDDIINAFDDPDVAVAGGFLHDHTGKTYQWRFGTVNRFGQADTDWDRAAPEYNFPGSAVYPHVMANSLFRRAAIVEVGGFDEEYEYFLDESDIILRFVDRGWKVAQLDRGFVHHKFMPSHIRNEARVLTSWYSVFKNTLYFSLLNAREHAGLDEILGVVNGKINEYRGHVEWAVREKMLSLSDKARFEDEVERALEDGLSRGLSAKRKLVEPDSLKGRGDVVVFPPIRPASEQRCYVFLTRTYPPSSIGGIGRFVYELARSVAKLGHQIHVLTAGDGHDRVDFEDGVWVHRICIKNHVAPTDIQVPSHIWNYSKTMLDEAIAIGERRKIDCVYAPIWDVEGIAFLLDGLYPLVISLQTTLHFYLATNPHKKTDMAFMRDFAEPMLALERKLLTESLGIIAISKSIATEIENTYGFTFEPSRMVHVPLGLLDWSNLPVVEPPALPTGRVRLCFIGRLESRKGIEVLLKIAPALIARHPSIHLDIVGNDTISAACGVTPRAEFESTHPGLIRDSRVIFHGEVDEERLRGFYRAADVVLAPSLFESFGLVHLEGMMFGKPVIGSNIGGMAEVIEDGTTGLLAAPGDASALTRSIERLVLDPNLRTKIGKAARQAFLTKFTADQMASGVVSALDRLSQPHAK
jgi:glycogen synthase